FDGIADTKPYFTELTYLYGNRTLLPAIEELFKADGLGSIGLIFDLKSKEWGDLENISDIIKENVAMETTIITNKNNTNTMNKNSNVNKNDNNKDYIVLFVVNSEYEQSKISKKKINNNKNNNNTMNKNNNVTNNDNNKDYIVPFNENSEYEQSKTSKENTIISSENINNENEGRTETIYQGFNKDRINFLVRI